jgi:hypothetical protein
MESLVKNNEVSSGVVKDGSLELLIKGILEDSSSTSPKQWEYWLLDDNAALIPCYHELQKPPGLGAV